MAQAQIVTKATAQQLAEWFVGRIYGTGQIDKKKGIGPSEFAKYADLKPDFMVPADEVFSRQGYFNVVRVVGGGLETYPQFEESEYIVGADPRTKQAVVPGSAITIKDRKYFVKLPNGTEKEVLLEAGIFNQAADVAVRSGLAAGNKIMLKQKHPQAGKIKTELVRPEVAAAWDKFFYLIRLISRAKQEIWSGEKNEKNRMAKLVAKIADIFYQYLVINGAPEAVKM